MVLSKKRITKVLIRLHGSAGWSAPVLFANPRRQVFPRRGPIIHVFFQTIFFSVNTRLQRLHSRQFKKVKYLDDIMISLSFQLIPGYRGYTVDSLKKINILDDIMISLSFQLIPGYRLLRLHSRQFKKV